MHEFFEKLPHNDSCPQMTTLIISNLNTNKINLLILFIKLVYYQNSNIVLKCIMGLYLDVPKNVLAYYHNKNINSKSFINVE